MLAVVNFAAFSPLLYLTRMASRRDPRLFYLLPSPLPSAFLLTSVPPSPSLTTTGVPSAPSAIALLLCTGSEMVLSWRAPARTGGAPVLGYYLDRREEGAELWREVNVKAARKRRLKVSSATAL